MDCLGLDRCEDSEIIEEIEIQIKYSGYIKRQLQQIARFKQLEARAIPAGFSYDAVMGFSNEVREKLKRVRPASLGQASRISGVTPAAISVLLVALEKHKRMSTMNQSSSFSPSTL
jgi:tRNA uridine 5-carboxymethylaminomethyl modification enzyme